MSTVHSFLFGLVRRSIIKDLKDNLKMTGRLVAIKLQAGKVPVVVRTVERSSPIVTASGADLEQDGTASLTLEGRSPREEEGVPSVCKILIERLNQAGVRPPRKLDRGDVEIWPFLQPGFGRLLRKFPGR
jgi:hypothetical protein